MNIPQESLHAIGQRLNRLKTAVDFQEGDRVPFIPKTESFPVTGYGLSYYDWMKDARNALPYVQRYLTD